MPAPLASAAPSTQRRSVSRWIASHAAGSAVVVLFFSFYAYLSSRPATDLPHDAHFYWEMAGAFWVNGQFDFLAFDSNLRGYLFPALLAPLAYLAKLYNWVPMDVTRVVGAAIAALLFGVVGPGLWRALQQGATPVEPVPLGRRLLFGALGFAFWREYFDYPLTDFPALLALASALWMLLRPRSLWNGLLAGILVAMAANFRPIYVAALPVATILYCWPRPINSVKQPRPWGPLLAFGVGVALIFWPQLTLNQTHFNVSSPLVLSKLHGGPNLYLTQLQWGLLYQKYETSIGTDYRTPQMNFLDEAGQALWTATGLTQFDSYEQYWEAAKLEPLTVIGVWLRHLFNGLDVQYPTPYVSVVFLPTWQLAWLNYTVLLGGLAIIASRVRRGFATLGSFNFQASLAMLALLSSCLASLPVAMECRFLLPVHLVLCAAFAFGAQPIQAWRAASWAQRAGALALYTVLLTACFAVSSAAQARLEHGPRYVFEWQQPAGQPW